jgi:hypothetical protein
MAHLGLIERDPKPEATHAPRGVSRAPDRKCVMKIIEKDKQNI